MKLTLNPFKASVALYQAGPNTLFSCGHFDEIELCSDTSPHLCRSVHMFSIVWTVAHCLRAGHHHNHGPPTECCTGWLQRDGQSRTPLEQCFTFKTTKCFLFVVKRVFDGSFRTDGYGEGKTRHNETLGGWPERVSATC